MDLVLWRHCEAEPGEPDLGRRLTPKGQKQAERLAAWLDARLPDTARILVSPAERAQQTAVALQRKFRTIPELAPGANVAAVLAAANWPESREPVLIVGHQPTLGGGRVVSARGRRSALVAAQRRRVVAVESREGKRRGRCVEGGGRTRFRVTL